jgi:hypothetical protein
VGAVSVWHLVGRGLLDLDEIDIGGRLLIA